MAGTASVAGNVLAIVTGYKAGAVVAGDYLVELPVPCNCRIGGIKVQASTAGAGAGNTVVDVLVNGASIYASAADKPTLLGTATGEFANSRTSRAHLRSSDLATGADVLSVQVASVPATTGHARVGVAVALEVPS